MLFDCCIKGTIFKILVQQEASLYDIRTLDLKEGDDVIYIKRIRYANDQPVIIEHVHLPGGRHTGYVFAF